MVTVVTGSDTLHLILVRFRTAVMMSRHSVKWAPRCHASVVARISRFAPDSMSTSGCDNPRMFTTSWWSGIYKPDSTLAITGTQSRTFYKVWDFDTCPLLRVIPISLAFQKG